MTGSDDSVLEYLSEHDVALPPTGLEINLNREGISISYSTIHRRLQKLQDKGMVEKVHKKKGYYAITEKGKQYLNGDLDARDIETDVSDTD